MRPKYIALPIIIYEGRVQIKGKKKVNPLHPFILELVVKENNLETIINAFNIDKRLVQEAIVDLMYKEYVYVDLESSKIYISPEIENFIDRGRLNDYLEDEFPETITLNWVQETVTGQIMMLNDIRDYLKVPPSLKGKWMESAEQLQLNRRNYINLQNFSLQTLIKTAKMVLRANISEGDIFERVNRVYDLKPANSRIMFIPMKPRTINEIEYYIPYSTSIPISVIEFWTKSLTKIDSYTINDLSPADEAYLSQYHWQTLLKKWNEINQDIGETLSKQFEERQMKRRFQKIFQDLENEALNYLIPQMMDFGANVGYINVELSKGQEILEKLDNAFSKAEDLVIIGSAFVNEISINKLIPLIERLNSKNVKVIFLWGLLGDEIENLKEKFPIFKNENIVFIKSRERFHSKFFIIENKYAWITSCNLFSYQYTEKSPTESICKLNHGPIIGEILEYALNNVDHKKAISWIKEITEGILIKDESVLEKENLLTKFQEIIIIELKEKCRVLIEQPKNKQELINFKTIFEKEKKLLRKIRKFETVILIENLEHRKLLRACLAQAKQNIRIGTDRINRQAVSSVIITAINNTLKRGVPIQVRWGRDDINTIPETDLFTIQKTIDNMLLETGNMIEISKHPSQSHAKFLTMDRNLLLITSFNLLAFAGNGLSNEDITDELGVVLSSQNWTLEVNKTFPNSKSLDKPVRKNLSKKSRKKHLR